MHSISPRLCENLVMMLRLCEMVGTYVLSEAESPTQSTQFSSQQSSIMAPGDPEVTEALNRNGSSMQLAQYMLCNIWMRLLSQHTSSVINRPQTPRVPTTRPCVFFHHA